MPAPRSGRPGLSRRLNRLGHLCRQQGALLAKQLAKAQAEQKPLRFGDVKVPAQIEQGHLPDASALTPRVDQTVAGIGFAGGHPAGDEAKDVHQARITQAKGVDRSYNNTMSLQNDFGKHP